jgi:hypothetical protein
MRAVTVPRAVVRYKNRASLIWIRQYLQTQGKSRLSLITKLYTERL